MTPNQQFVLALLAALVTLLESWRRVRKRNSLRPGAPSDPMASNPDATDPDLPRHHQRKGKR